MIELYFVLYRIPKMMTQLARERNRSPVGWSLLAIFAWFGAEFFVAVALGVFYQVGVLLWKWPELTSGTTLLIYVPGLAAAILSFTIVSRILRSKPLALALPVPPPPPQFSNPNSIT